MEDQKISPNAKEWECILIAYKMEDPDSKNIYKKEEHLVSSNKSLYQFWSDHGCRYFNSFQISKKKELFKKWVEILYPFSIDIAKIENDISSENQKRRERALQSRIRLNTGHSYDLLPHEIDRLYGNYC
jgi:hypothetical protein